MKKINFWSFSDEFKFLKKKKLINSINENLKNGDIFFGNAINNFEKKFLSFNKSKYGISVKNGTDAIILSLLACGVKPGDEVITVSLTAIPTISAIVSVGAKPVFIDIGDDYLINTKLIEKKISSKTKVIIPVHLYGKTCDMNKILKLSKKLNIKVIEDCAQSFGSKYKNQYSGNIGDYGCFSFYPTKVLGAYGDGGFIVCKTKKDYFKLKRLSFYGLERNDKNSEYFKKYFSVEHGLNSRMDSIQAAILTLKLKYLKEWIRKRKRIANFYNRSFSKKKPKNSQNHVYHLYVLRSKYRDKIISEMKKHNIYLSTHYSYPTHKMTPYKKFVNNKYDNLEKSEKAAKELFSLPLHPFLTQKDQKIIVSNLKSLRNIYEFK